MNTDTPHVQKNSTTEYVGYRVFAALNALDTKFSGSKVKPNH